MRKVIISHLSISKRVKAKEMLSAYTLNYEYPTSTSTPLILHPISSSANQTKHRWQKKISLIYKVKMVLLLWQFKSVVAV